MQKRFFGKFLSVLLAAVLALPGSIPVSHAAENVVSDEQILESAEAAESSSEEEIAAETENASVQTSGSNTRGGV